MTAALAVTALILSCGDNEDVDVSVSITGITDTTTTSAKVSVSYAAGNVNIAEVGVVYGATPGRLNIQTIINGGVPNVDYGIISAPASVSGRYYADLVNLADGTTYFVTPFVKLDKSSGEFPEGYFMPSGYVTFKTIFAGGTLPVVSACDITERTYTSAKLEATIEVVGNPSYIRKGFCYGASPEPMLDDGNSTCVPVYGPEYLFSETITGLSGNTAYNVRAYVSNNRHPTQYGKTTVFRTQGENGEILIDTRDGQEYKIIEIGRFTWMVKNLNYTANNSWCYDDTEPNCENYGRLYTWDAARNACPDGWSLPTRFQWNDLVDAVGGTANAGMALKSTAWDGTDNFGFSALPGGYRESARYFNIEWFGSWWTATQNGTSVYYKSMQTGSNSMGESSSGSNLGRSVRCVKN